MNGRPALDHLLDLYGPTAERVVVVVNPSAEAAVAAVCRGRPVDIRIARQDAPTGMLDAITAARPHVLDAAPARVWITWCDQVAIHPQTVHALDVLSARPPEPALVFPTARQQPPYIHIRRDARGRVVDVLHRREGDLMPEVGESDMGLFSLSAETYLERLVEFQRRAGEGAATGERNFLPFIPWLTARGADVRTFRCCDEREAIGFNTLEDLRAIERYLLEPRPAVGSVPTVRDQ